MHHAAGFNYKEPGDRRGREHGGTEKKCKNRLMATIWQELVWYQHILTSPSKLHHVINWSICPFGLNRVITSWCTQLTVFTAARQSWVFSPNKSEISRPDRWKLKPAKSDKNVPFHHSFSSSHQRLSLSLFQVAGDSKLTWPPLLPVAANRENRGQITTQKNNSIHPSSISA